MHKIGHTIKSRKSPNDKIYTPKPVAIKMIEMCEIKKGDKVLDPSKGGGVFYNNFPTYCIKDYCEIEEQKDFFNYNNKVDCVIGNPPYSLWTNWIDHTMEITNKFCYIFGIMNLTDTRLKHIIDKGFGITKIHILKIDWWFGHQYLILFEKDKPSIMTVEDMRIFCDICNNKPKKCKRGNKGINPNLCSNNINVKN